MNDEIKFNTQKTVRFSKLGRKSCIPSFINQNNYEHIFGFKNYPNLPIDSKYF